MADSQAPTHIAYSRQRISKTRFVWLEIGKGRMEGNGVFHGLLNVSPLADLVGMCISRRLARPRRPRTSRNARMMPARIKTDALGHRALYSEVEFMRGSVRALVHDRL